MFKRNADLLLMTVITAIVVVMFLPVPGMAGSLEPSSPPAPTMRTLDEIYSASSWSKKLPSSERFVVLAGFNNEAVLDKETGLVWEKTPSTYDPLRGNFYHAVYDCLSKRVGGRMGWHLPTVQQLESLIDLTQVGQGSLALPSGHPFSNVQEDYWSMSTSPNGSDRAYVVFMTDGTPNSLGMFKSDPSVKHNYWCVRGGQTYDAY